MKALMTAVAALALFVACGCASPEPSRPAESGGALPPPELAPAEAAPAEAAPSSTTGASGEGVVVETIEPDPAAAAEPTAVTIPEGAGWTQPGVPLTKQQEDIETCFNFATAQVARETQLDQDRYESSSDRDTLDFYGETTLTRRVDYYSERRRRGILFDNCMQAKGYVKN
jgi:hypothetical protein